MRHTSTLATLLLAAVAAASPAGAQQATREADHSAHHPVTTAPVASATLSDGEVRKVDRKQGKVTLRHGPIANLDMPAMTMVFTAAEAKLLDWLKEVDRNRFSAGKKDGTYLLLSVQPAT